MRTTAVSCLMVIACVAQASILYVPDDFADLQSALNAAQSNDTIICRPGIHDGLYSIPPIQLTLGSEFLLNPDTSLISTTIIQPNEETPGRCLTADSAASRDTTLTIVGLSVAFGSATYGGGLYVDHRTVNMRDCIFSFNSARSGAAVHAQACSLTMSRCRFFENDAQESGRVLYGLRCEIMFDSCEIGRNVSTTDEWAVPGDISVFSGNLELRNCQIHEVGQVRGPCPLINHAIGGAGPWEIRISGCTFTNCRLKVLYESGGTAANQFILDSCAFIDNEIGFGIFRGWEYAGMARAQITRNWFENNRRFSIYGMQGLIVMDIRPSRCIVEENYFDSNVGYFYGCVGISNAGHPQYRRLWRNYFVNNSSSPQEDGGSKTVHLSQVFPGVMEYNAFIGNQGHAVYTTTWYDSTGYALNNYWGSESGPYEAVGNPNGQGDTTDSRTRYAPWLESEDDIPDSTILPNPAGEWQWPVPSTWYIESVFPNPFNSRFTVELNGMAGSSFEIRLYDLLGREVALLHSGRALRGNLSFDAPAILATGVYFLHAKDRYYSEVKKVLFLK